MKRLIVACAIVLFIGLVFSLLLAVSKNIPSQNKNLIVKLDKENWIVTVNTDTGEIKRIYHSDKYWTHTLTVSPNNKYIAFIEETKPEYKRDGYEVAPQYCLVIIDDSGKLISRIERDVKKYVWSPDGEKIAFLTFRPCDPDYAYKCPSGAWVFDINTSETIKIRDRASQVNWAIFDSAVYLFDYRTVIRWNPRSKELDSTGYKGIYFSPDGKYYLALSSEDYPHLYVSSTNQEITNRVKTRFGYLPRGWMSDQKHHMLAVKVDYEPTPEDTISSGRPRAMVKGERKIIQKTFFIYDVEKDQVIKEWIEKP